MKCLLIHAFRRKVCFGLCRPCLLEHMDREDAKRRHPAGKQR